MLTGNGDAEADVFCLGHEFDGPVGDVITFIIVGNNGTDGEDESAGLEHLINPYQILEGVIVRGAFEILIERLGRDAQCLHYISFVCVGLLRLIQEGDCLANRERVVEVLHVDTCGDGADREVWRLGVRT